MRRLLPLLTSIACGASDLPELGALDASTPDSAVDAETLDPPSSWTELVGGRLALHTDQPATCAECDDLDHDGLADAWEAIALDAFRPAVRVAEGDPHLTNPNAHLLQIARLFPVSFDPLLVRALIAVAWSEDYGSTCGGISGHAGDPERVALELESFASDRPNDVIVARAYTAAHEGTLGDASRLFPLEDLGELEHGSEPRWMIYASLRKHASFASVRLCEEASKLPCVRETCGSHAELFPGALNAGEPDSPLIDDLASHGFAGDLAWTDTDFCGGLDRGPCAGPLSNKLLDDPFALAR